MKYGYVFSVKNPNMINRVFYIVLICLFGAGFQQMHAQTSISRSVLKSLQVQEDSLKVLSDSLINAGIRLCGCAPTASSSVPWCGVSR